MDMPLVLKCAVGDGYAIGAEMRRWGWNTPLALECTVGDGIRRSRWNAL
jgi:hypothetical protein